VVVTHAVIVGSVAYEFDRKISFVPFGSDTQTTLCFSFHQPTMEVYFWKCFGHFSRAGEGAAEDALKIVYPAQFLSETKNEDTLQLGPRTGKQESIF